MICRYDVIARRDLPVGGITKAARVASIEVHVPAVSHNYVVDGIRGGLFSVVDVTPQPKPEPAAPAAPATKPLDRQNKAELEATAAALGIEIPEGATKAQILEIIAAEAEAD